MEIILKGEEKIYFRSYISLRGTISNSIYLYGTI